LFVRIFPPDRGVTAKQKIFCTGLKNATFMTRPRLFEFSGSYLKEQCLDIFIFRQILNLLQKLVSIGQFNFDIFNS